MREPRYLLAEQKTARGAPLLCGYTEYEMLHQLADKLGFELRPIGGPSPIAAELETALLQFARAMTKHPDKAVRRPAKRALHKYNKARR